MNKKIVSAIYFLIFILVFGISLIIPANSLRISLIAGISGMAICLAGTIFQTVFKNPIASPNILGVTTGVSIGNIVFVMTFQLMAYNFLGYRYFICYSLVAVIVLLTVLAGRLVNRRNKTFSVEVMIIVGMMVTHLGSVFVTYYQYLLSGDETGLLEIYTTLANGDLIYTDNQSILIFAIVMLISVVPMILIGYRFNSIAFSDDEMKATGISNERLRVFGLVFGSIMSAAAIIHCGDIGFVSMVIPFICRKNGRTEFREVAFKSMMIGGIISILSRVLLNYIKTFGVALPANVIITLIVLPIFVISLIKRDGAVQ